VHSWRLFPKSLLLNMKSIFTDKNSKPTEEQLNDRIGVTSSLWHELEAFTKSSYPKASSAWHFSEEKYGWSYRISDAKRVIIYLLPREAYFKVAFVFGQKAFDKILESTISASIKEELRAAKVYAEGRGIRIDVKDEHVMSDVKELINIKLEI
jgi:hypothetical protein